MIAADCVGGVGIQCAKWAAELVANGSRAQVVIWDDRSAPPGDRLDLIDFGPVECHQVEYDHLDKPSVVALRVARQLALADGDVLLATNLNPAICDFIARARRSGLSCLYVQCLVSDNAGAYRCLRRHLTSCDLVVTGSKEMARKASQVIRQSACNTPVVVCPPGARVQDRPLGNSHDDCLRVCYLGRIEQADKRVFDLPKIMRLVRERGVAAHLTIIGRGTSKPQLEQLIEEERLTDCVSFQTWQAHGAAMELLKRQQVLLLPSSYEGFSGALCEAMAAGVVPIATRVSGSDEAIIHGYNGYLAEVGDVAAMARLVCDLARDFSLYQTLSKRACQTAGEHYSVSASVARLSSSVKELSHRAFQVPPRLSPARALLGSDSPLLPNRVARDVKRLAQSLKRRLPPAVLRRLRTWAWSIKGF